MRKALLIFIVFGGLVIFASLRASGSRAGLWFEITGAILAVVVGAWMVVFGALLRFRRVNPSRVWGYSSNGTVLTGIGAILLFFDALPVLRDFEFELAGVLWMASAAALVVGAYLERGERG